MADPLNWLLLAEFIVIVIVVSAFLFYWNRLLGSLFAWIIRLLTWKKYNAYITIGSLQISPLAGRLSFRDVEYHSSNLSFRALNGHITFRYWLFRVRQEGDSASAKRSKLPCRISVYAQGVEGFVYNRTPAYDEIVKRMKKHEKEQEQEQAGNVNAKDKPTPPSSQSSSVDSNGNGKGFKTRLRKVYKAGGELFEKEQPLEYVSSAETTEYPPKPGQVPNAPLPTPTPPPVQGVDWFREAMPMELKIITGSFALGSDATPMVLIGDFKSASGTIEVTDSRSIFDRYKMSVDLHFDAPKVLMRTNIDWSGPLLAHGKKVYDELIKKKPEITKSPPSALSARWGFHLLARKFKFLRDPKFSSPPAVGLPPDRQWKGLARYRMQEEQEAKKKPLKEEREYAKVATLLDSPALDLTYYADTPGVVPHPFEVRVVDTNDQFGNVDLPPEYGIDVVIHGGLVKYGPWADRQRDALQKTFAPSIFFDTEARERLKPGDLRIHTHMVLNLLLSEDTTLHIPTREPSKDWQFDSVPRGDHRIERKYGYMDVLARANSSIVYTQAQFATKTGYDAMLVLHLDTLSIVSSVNDASFLKAKACKLSLTMPTPLEWNSQRNWGLDLTLEDPDITLLRDHVTLISDIAKDWSSGATGDYHHFVPIHYNFRISLLNYAVHLFLNDFNIVDLPDQRDANAMMDILGPRLISHAAVSTTQYRPEFSVVPFSVTANDARVTLGLPEWDTHRSFGEPPTFEVGKIGEISANGSYRYYSNASPDHQETLILHLEGRRVVYKALGWALRRMFCLKDNYFGGFTQFTQMDEYTNTAVRIDQVGDPILKKWRPGKSDPFGVQVTMNVEESMILMSDEIYNAKSGLAMPVPRLQMALKSIDAFMELSLDSPPTYVTSIPDLKATYDAGICPSPRPNEAVYVEGIAVKANRLFGPQPLATTYLCLWEIGVPKITALLTPTFLDVLKASISAVAYNYVDVENAPAPNFVPPTPPDVTFVKLALESAAITLFAGDAALAVNLSSGVNLDLSTLATRSYSSSIGILIPSIDVNLLRKVGRRKWKSVSAMKTSLSMDMYKAPENWAERAAKQQEFIAKEDGETGRIWYMYREGDEEVEGHHVHGVYLPHPRAVGKDFFDDDATSLNPSIQSQPEMSSSASTNDDRDFDFGAIRPRPRSRSRSFATAREELSQASSDESDTVTSGSDSGSMSSETSWASNSGMAAALDSKLKEIHALRSHFSWKAPPMTPGKNSFATAAGAAVRQTSYGKIIHLRLLDVVAEADSTVLACLGDIAKEMEKVHRPPERILDALLDGQVDAFQGDEDDALPTTIDASMPSITLRITSLGNKGERVSAATLDLSGFAATFQKRPLLTSDPPHSGAEGATQATTTAEINGVRLVLATLQPIRGDISLAETGLSWADIDSQPVLAIEGRGWGVTHTSDKAINRIQVACAASDTHFVTPVLETAMGTASAWRSAIEATPLSALGAITRPYQKDRPARVIYGIVRLTDSYMANASQPTFRVVTPYGLHQLDHRSIRLNDGFWLLARLRFWYRQSLQLSSPDDVRDVKQETPNLEWAVHRMQQLNDNSADDASLDVVWQQHFVQTAFAPYKPKAPNAETPTQEVSASLHHFAVKHHGRYLGSKALAESGLQIRRLCTGVHRSQSLRDGAPVAQTRVVVAILAIELEVQNSVLAAFQKIISCLEQSRKPEDNLPAIDPDSPVLQRQDPQVDNVNNLLVDINVGRLEASLVVGDLRLRSLLQSTRHSFSQHRRTRYIGSQVAMSGKTTITSTIELVDVTLFQVRQALAQVEETLRDRIVMSFTIKKSRAMLNEIVPHNSKVHQWHVLVSADALAFDSRPLIKAFLDFAQEWKKEHYPNYQPLIDEMKEIYSRRPSKIKTAPRTASHIQSDILINEAHFQIRAAKAVWLRWDLGKTFLSCQHFEHHERFGLRTAPQVVGAYSSNKASKTADAPMLRLPSIGATGMRKQMKTGQHLLVASLNFGFFTAVIKPALLDRLLSLHQKLGKDLMDVYRDYMDGLSGAFKSRTTASPAASTPGKIQTAPPATLIDLHINVKGVRFGLRADEVAATLLFEALSLHGHASNQGTPNSAVLWRAKCDHLGLSLGQIDHGSLSSDIEPVRKHRSAYMVLDVDVHETPDAGLSASRLGVALNHVHTVMHIAALSELIDLLKAWSSDIHTLTENRKAEVAEVKQQTEQLFKKVEGLERGTQPENSWFASRLLTVDVAGFGIAIPLVADTEFNFQKQGTQPVPALLFSIRSVNFQNRRNETARFRMTQMALRFLNEFDQGVPEHFSGDFNPSRNRMSLPSLDAEAQMYTAEDRWIVSAHCSATDFKLSLSPDVIDGVFQLIKLYDQGRERIVLIEQDFRTKMPVKEKSQTVSSTYHSSPITPMERTSQRIFVRISFTFNTGLVEMHRTPEDAEPRTLVSDERGRPTRIGWHDTFKLPTISAWLDYAGSDSSAPPAEREASLVFNSAVHESTNTLRPSILPFFKDIQKRVKHNLESRSNKSSPVVRDDADIPVSISNESALQALAKATSSRLTVKTTLRIDQSELTFNCAPDSNAFFKLKWASGGFVASTTLGAEGTSSVAATISGVSAELSHEFAGVGQSCIEGASKDMVLSVVYAPDADCIGTTGPGLSVILDTSLSGKFRLETYSALLSFMAVWADSEMRDGIGLIAAAPETTPPISMPNFAGPKLNWVVLARIRSLDFDAEISVSHVQLAISPITVRAMSNGENISVNLEIGTTQMSAEGGISGDIMSESLVFSTTRRSSRASENSDPNVLAMRIAGGNLSGNLFLGDTNVVRFHLDPSTVTLADDWRDFARDSNTAVLLSFDVQAGQFQGVIRLFAVPDLLHDVYEIFNRVESQETTAANRSVAYRTQRHHKRVNPSQFANVLHQTLRKTAEGEESAIPKTAQTMRFDLSGIDIAVFNEDDYRADNSDFWRFIVGKVEADLKRDRTRGNLPKRDLHLSVQSVRWDTSTWSQAKSVEQREMSAQELIDKIVKTVGRREVVSLPPMTLAMSSHEYPGPPTVEYDFSLDWGGGDGDVAVLPNFFGRAAEAAKKFNTELDNAARTRDFSRPPMDASPLKDIKDNIADKEPLQYRARDPSSDTMPIPRLKMLGEGTRDAARLIPQVKAFVNNLPVLSHRFVTLPLEEGMDLLLKLYEKQLPDRDEK